MTVPSESSPAKSPTKRWQFGLRQLLVAIALISGACGTAMLAYQSFMAYRQVQLAIEIFVTPVLFAVAIGLICRASVLKSVLCGALLGSILACSLSPAANFLVVVPATVAVVLARKCANPVVIQAEQIDERRQRSVYRMSAIACIILLILWLPLPFMVGPSKACRPMGQDLFTFVLVLPITVIAFLRAALQLLVAEPKKRGLIAIAVSLLPIVVYILSQWLILSVLGIVYED